MNESSSPSPTRLAPTAPRARDGVLVALLGLAVRAAVVLWAASRIPPVEDGHFYHVVAARIARGLGYTWEWPDGAVTFAAHYPVGYPGLVGALYSAFGPEPVVAMTLNAVLGAASVYAAHRIVASEGNRRAAVFAALLVALHPGLVAYTPALMTEGTAAAFLMLAGWGVVAARDASRPFARTTLSGLVLGVATLVRPQSLLMAPFFGALATRGRRPRLRLALGALATVGALAVCVPWTVRNCVRMNSCLLVSANAGWNLFIGAADGATGTFTPLEALGVPEECRTVWGEAEKDACFGRAGRAAVVRHPVHFLSLVPAKLAQTFDYAGAAGWYLHASNPSAFGDGAKVVLGAVETIYERLVVLAVLAVGAFAPGPRARARRVAGVISAAFLASRAAWVSHLGLCVEVALLGRAALDRLPLALTATTVAATAATHAVFFGAGRYSLVCFPALSALAGSVLTVGAGAGNNGRSKES